MRCHGDGDAIPNGISIVQHANLFPAYRAKLGARLNEELLLKLLLVICTPGTIEQLYSKINP
jgi:hypothetical protein